MNLNQAIRTARTFVAGDAIDGDEDDVMDEVIGALLAEIKRSNDSTTKVAFETIKQAMIDDNPVQPGSYAHGWHCNIAMMCYDAMMAHGEISPENFTDGCHKVSNDAASRFMKLCFDVETKQ